MDQSKKYQKPDMQVLYMDRWVSKTHFRVFVYNTDYEKLAENYDEYCKLIASGLWFDRKPQKLIIPVDEVKEIDLLEENKPIPINQGRRGRPPKRT